MPAKSSQPGPDPPVSLSCSPDPPVSGGPGFVGGTVASSWVIVTVAVARSPIVAPAASVIVAVSSRFPAPTGGAQRTHRRRE